MGPAPLHLQTHVGMEPSSLVLQKWSRPPSSTGWRRQDVGSEKRAKPVVVLDPVSTREPQTKDQVAAQDPTRREDDEGDVKPEHKEDSTERLRDTDSSSC
ncbi:shootin 1 [Phyllostomus discolor]|uniref:Shootin 1 n=1 Tax=Phyllostomus discolor TaxID=89673 RepID=A0A834AAZ6_9CHIR|nr:shootin 1 [Phyllostomus discolor]